MTLDSLNLIIGIDQTGAKYKNNQAKPLPACALLKEKKSWRLIAINKLSNLSINTINNELKSYSNISFESSKCVIVMDCVLKLPNKNFAFTKKCIQQTKKYTGFGFDVSKRFFNDLRSEYFALNDLLKRESESYLGANSVFESLPYQKNIQTGTFRLWKDLSSWQRGGYNFNLRKNKIGSCSLIEAYPSLAWRILNSSSRNKPLTHKFYSRLKEIENLQAIESMDLDTKDAAIICLLFYYLTKKNSAPYKDDILGISYYLRQETSG